MNVKIKRLHPDAVIPQYAHDYDAGFDLVATEDVIVEPGETVKVPTGLAFEIPQGFEMQIRPRSGVTLKTKLRVQLGTVDAGYRGEVGVIVDNVSQKEYWAEDFSFIVEVTEDYELTDGTMKSSGYFQKWTSYQPKGTYLIRKGDRIAQAVIKRVEHAQFIEVDTLSETARGDGGFGSSGVNVIGNN